MAVSVEDPVQIGVPQGVEHVRVCDRDWVEAHAPLHVVQEVQLPHVGGTGQHI